MLKIEICSYFHDQIGGSAIASCKRSAADALPGPRNCARLRKRTVAAPWGRLGVRIARSAHPETPTIITSSAWTKASPWTVKARNNIICLVFLTVFIIRLLRQDLFAFRSEKWM